MNYWKYKNERLQLYILCRVTYLIKYFGINAHFYVLNTHFTEMKNIHFHKLLTLANRNVLFYK